MKGAKTTLEDARAVVFSYMQCVFRVQAYPTVGIELTQKPIDMAVMGTVSSRLVVGIGRLLATDTYAPCSQFHRWDPQSLKLGGQ